MDLVMKEISMVKSLKGCPNMVTLHLHTISDLGGRKEAILVMEFYEKFLVNVLGSRGAAYFEEKQVLTIFRDVCNAVFATHCRSPTFAHLDLKAENLLLAQMDCGSSVIMEAPLPITSALRSLKKWG
ncbi:hypothetical protein Nepgr_006298 [Nepenthes gracilis]|uniref:non-specific serine/threonine protein kinase n=1 Tax=Nepenthes gracilis TaxID=150966 RepID=A0AAD3S4R3_NEPGR|nr:hypothetical protein Nepgr_006298 [Nepenthes gracilis]